MSFDDMRIKKWLSFDEIFCHFGHNMHVANFIANTAESTIDIDCELFG